MTARPLSGLGVLVCRPRHDAAALATALRGAGATPICVPVIEVVDPDDGGVALRSTLSTLSADEWLVVTSPNGAARV
ncbi:MAG: uroporphyrinogen-III synthase, partial [Acidimicrobiales bacterium]